MSETHPCAPDATTRIFDLLDHWRHLPDYQLERRADVFFAAYLPQFLAHRWGMASAVQVIPEFPLRLGTLYPAAGQRNQSCKADYLALAPDLSRAAFVELKTDALSRRTEQDKYL